MQMPKCACELLKMAAKDAHCMRAIEFYFVTNEMEKWRNGSRMEIEWENGRVKNEK